MSSNVSQSGDHLYQAPDDRPAVVSDVPARQGVTRHHVRDVLLFIMLGDKIEDDDAWTLLN
jgi:hypothetical protein